MSVPALPRTPALASVLDRAETDARAHGHRRLSSEHLLLALLTDPVGGAAPVLAALKMDPTAGRAEIAEVMPGRGRPIDEAPRLTESAQGALRRAEAIAHRFHAVAVDTDHLLLGLTNQVESAAARVLLDFGASSEKIGTLVERGTGQAHPPSCARCGAALEVAWRYCPMCGTARGAAG
jgi:ATP-dependent Clp protease ATP-binding subunit ClpA